MTCAAVIPLIAGRTAGVLNIGSGVGHSTLDVVRAIEQILARPVALEFAPARAGDVPRIILDAVKFSCARRASRTPFCGWRAAIRQ